MRRIRLDLFICMLLATALFAGIFFVGDKLDLMEKFFDVLETVVDDEEINSADNSETMNTTMIVLSVIFSAMPLLLFVLYMVTIFAIHSVFVKKGIFPPVFPNMKI